MNELDKSKDKRANYTLNKIGIQFISFGVNLLIFTDIFFTKFKTNSIFEVSKFSKFTPRKLSLFYLFRNYKC